MTTQTPILKEIKDNWMVILFIGGLIVTWTTFDARLTQAENKIDQLSDVVTEINQININLAIIQTDLQYIKDKINK